MLQTSRLYNVWNYIDQVLLLHCREVAWIEVLIQLKFIEIIAYITILEKRRNIHMQVIV